MEAIALNATQFQHGGQQFARKRYPILLSEEIDSTRELDR
jgi:hypothetical protein